MDGQMDRSVITNYSQLSRKRPPLVHEKVVAYERWSLTGTINEMSPTNSNYYYISYYF